LLAIGCASDQRDRSEEAGVPQVDIAARLAGVPLFSGCTRRELSVVARAAKLVSHRTGTVIAREGERGIGLFVILEGTCSVTVGGNEKARLGPGQFFGEIALLDGGPRTATVTTVTDVRLLGLTEWVFRGLLAEHSSIALKTLESVAGRLRGVAKERV
jgi:CRP/FNR family cyclic AMP-dependent transcriptional regulator